MSHFHFFSYFHLFYIIFSLEKEHGLSDICKQDVNVEEKKARCVDVKVRHLQPWLSFDRRY